MIHTCKYCPELQAEVFSSCSLGDIQEGPLQRKLKFPDRFLGSLFASEPKKLSALHYLPI